MLYSQFQQSLQISSLQDQHPFLDLLHIPLSFFPIIFREWSWQNFFSKWGNVRNFHNFCLLLGPQFYVYFCAIILVDHCSCCWWVIYSICQQALEKNLLQWHGMQVAWHIQSGFSFVVSGQSRSTAWLNNPILRFIWKLIQPPYVKATFPFWTHELELTQKTTHALHEQHDPKPRKISKGSSKFFWW